METQSIYSLAFYASLKIFHLYYGHQQYYSGVKPGEPITIRGLLVDLLTYAIVFDAFCISPCLTKGD